MASLNKMCKNSLLFLSDGGSARAVMCLDLSRGNKSFSFCHYHVIAMSAESQPVLIKNPKSVQSKTETGPWQYISLYMPIYVCVSISVCMYR